MQNNRKILMEKQEIRHLRLQYLRRMKQYRLENRSIIYMDETYIHSSHTHLKGWSDDTNEGLRQPTSKGDRLILIHAGNEKGFVSNSFTCWKSSSKTGDYHHEMNFDNYEKWVKEKLIPNLPEKSVVVIDNAPYHNTLLEKLPTSTSTKPLIQKWLSERNIHFSPDMLKPDLYNIIKMHKPTYKLYKIDSLFHQYGHEVLRLPPYHPDLNPIETVWAALKHFVADKNVNFNFTKVIDCCKEFFLTFTAEQWNLRVERTKTIEKEFMDIEPLLDTVIDKVIINLNESDDDSCSEFSDSDVDEDSVDDYADGDNYTVISEPSTSKSYFSL